jgi:elongation factor 1-beta
MGQIVAEYDLMPESTEIDLKEVIETLHGIVPKGVKIIETKIAPVAFGLMKVRAGFVIDDTDESIGSKLENALGSIKGIENVECISNTVL